MSAMADWTTAHLWLVQASSHLVSCLVKASLLAVVFLMFLLDWDLYTCPQTLVLATACLRSSAIKTTPNPNKNGSYHQDTKGVPKSEGYLKSEFSGSQKGGIKGGGEEGRSGGKVNRSEGERGGKNEGKGVGGKGPESALEKL